MADSKQAPLDAAAAAKAAFASVQDKPFPDDVFTAPELRWAVIGCGVIANQMAQSLALAGRKLAGVANRTLSKLKLLPSSMASRRSMTRSRTSMPIRTSTRSISPRRITRISPTCAPL